MGGPFAGCTMVSNHGRAARPSKKRSGSGRGPVGVRLRSGSGLSSLCLPSCVLESRSSLIICDLIISYRLSTIDHRLSTIDH